MLDISHLTVSYKEEKPALLDFSLKVGPGETVSLVGESGCGKTTAIRSVMGLLPEGGRVVSGKIEFEGNDLLSLTPKQLRQLCGSRIAMIFQNPGAMLNPTRTIGSQFIECIQAHSKMSGREASALCKGKLESMNLPHAGELMKAYPFELSGGQLQRVGIAMAIAFSPRLLLADEPTSALDVTTQAQIARELMKLGKQNGVSIVMVTHNLGLAAYMSDRILVMRRGRVVDITDKNSLSAGHVCGYTRELLKALPSLGGNRYV